MSAALVMACAGQLGSYHCSFTPRLKCLRKEFVLWCRGAGAVGGCTGPAVDRSVLNKDLLALVEELKPAQTEVAARTQAYALVRSILLTRWSDAHVHVFGSTANTLSICNNNNIDMCLELPNLPDVPVGHRPLEHLAVKPHLLQYASDHLRHCTHMRHGIMPPWSAMHL